MLNMDVITKQLLTRMLWRLITTIINPITQKSDANSKTDL